MLITRIDIRHLRCCLAVADLASFRRASEVLGIAQPAVSRTIRDTEEEIGFAIFERTTRRVTVTPRGEAFLADARVTLAQFERTIRGSMKGSGGFAGHVIVGYSALANSLEITQRLERFQRANPKVQVEMHVQSTDTMVAGLRRGTIDVAFLLDHNSVEREGLQFDELWHSPLALVAPDTMGSERIHARELADMDLVLGVRENWRSYRILLDAGFRKLGIRPKVADEVWDVQVLFQRVIDGRGMTIFPASIGEHLPHRLAMVGLDGFPARATIAMAYGASADTGLLRAFRRSFETQPLAIDT
jgi:DNA-binding transcriptional LysR family regulator